MVSFNFTRISDSSSPYSFFNYPSINDRGTVGIEAFVDPAAPAAPPAAILVGNGGATTTIADISGSFAITFGINSINEVGTVAFGAVLDDGSNGIFTGSGGPTTRIIDSTGPFSFFTAPSINDVGTVAFAAGLDTGDTGIFTNSGGATTTIANTSGLFSAFSIGLDTAGANGPLRPYTIPSINNTGTLSFTAGLDTGDTGIFTGSSGETTTIADTSGPFSAFSSSSSINDAGVVAFLAELDAGGRGIFTGSGGEITTIVDDRSAFSYFNSDPSINEVGMVAFAAGLDEGGFGIFTGSDPVANKVITVGDFLLDSTVTELFFRKDGLNNAGQVAFQARLADGTQAIFRADPVSVPEPISGTGYVVALGMLSAWLWLRKKTKQEPIPKS